jgi:pimeloyl-ACP methyl ester carboxylesterase
MPRAANGDIEIEYETIGDRQDRPLLLIMGLATQLISWDDALCRAFADHGHFVIRFDNRDSGLSTKTPGRPPRLSSSLASAITRGHLGRSAPYTLADMAGDALAVLDDLAIDRAHVVGVSMGGMIGQMLAIDHRDRLLTLTSMISTTGAPRVGRATPRVMAHLLLPAATSRDQAIERTVRMRRLISGPHFDEAATRKQATTAHDRSFHPDGRRFQLTAITATGDRTSRLASVTTPTLVIHGDVDPLIHVSGGRATAAAIPGARLITFPDLGHGLPPARWDDLVSAITEHTTAHHTGGSTSERSPTR